MKTTAKTAVLNTEGHVLLLRRSLDDDARPGDWDLPGGGVDPGEDIMQAATRELAEEAGIVVAPTALKLVYSGTTFAEEQSESQNRLLFVIKVSETNVTLSPEHISYQWLPVSDILQTWQHSFWSKGIEYALSHDLLP